MIEKKMKKIEGKIKEITVNEGNVFLIKEEYKNDFPDIYIMEEYFILNYGPEYGEELHGVLMRICNNLNYCIIYDFGEYEFYSNGLKHRINDLPATVFSDGTKHWYRKGVMHRGNCSPALITDDGDTKRWFNKGIEFFPN